MKKRRGLILFFIVLLVIFIIPIVIFAFHFFSWPPTLSNNLIDWASFGSYFGGILSPLIGLANIVILWYITVLVEDANSKRAVKDELFNINNLNLTMMQNSFINIENKFKNVDAGQVFELINMLEDTDITPEEFLKQQRRIKRSFLNVFNEVDFFKNNQKLIFKYLNKNNESYPGEIIKNLDSSIKAVILKLSNNTIPDETEIKKVIFDYFDSRDMFLQSLLLEIKKSIIIVKND